MMYMASPYSSNELGAKGFRYSEAVRAAAHLTTLELIIFSPIVHSHPIAFLGDLPGNWDFWNYFDEKIISVCDRFAILELDGWRDSVGIKNEISIALKYNLSIESVNPATYNIDTYIDPVQLLKELNG